MALTPSPEDPAPREPIAIIGIGCRFPGEADDPAGFWRNLAQGVDAVREIPQDRWNPLQDYDPRLGIPGRTYSKWGGFLGRIDGFEPEAFGISPREARFIDPQQRLLLETASEALEDGGQFPETLAGTPVGVFVGISTNEYANLQSTAHDTRDVEVHTATGGAFSIAANRVSYCFNFKGPSVAVDTACSSSLVATHLACSSLWQGESTLALAGGVNVIIGASNYIAFSAATMLSPTGRCRAFDAGADGFVRGEGAGMVLLKPLSRAIADGDRIHALILATAVNQDGRTSGITVPDGEMQAALVREACRRAGLKPSDVQYVEAHGTGTAVGDPIEARALGAVLSEGREAGHPCMVGSVKSHIGHLEAGAGVAGLIKTALAIEQRRIPGNLHFEKPNPHIPFEELGLEVAVGTRAWPRDDRPLVAGVNSFGFGGTNAHVILSDYQPATVEGPALPASPEAAAQTSSKGAAPASTKTAAQGSPERASRTPAAATDSEPSPDVLPLSARSPEALQEFARRVRARVSQEDAPAPADIAHTVRTRRARHPHGVSVVFSDRAGLLAGLDSVVNGERAAGVFPVQRIGQTAPPVVFAFCGQGSQWARMGHELLRHEPVYRRTLEACEATLAKLADWSLIEELGRDEADSRLQRTAIAQPAIFAVQAGLADLWKSRGIHPAAVLGHSSGEIAAAYAAGIYTLAEATRIVFHRGRSMDRPSSEGAMIAAGLGVDEALELIAPLADRVSVAAANSPRSITLAGEPQALAEVSRMLTEREIFNRQLRVRYAFHSPLLDPVHDDLVQGIGDTESHAGTVPLFSTVTGAPAAAAELTAEYWWRGLRDRVRFADAVGLALAQGMTTFLEVGPHPVLSGYIAECLHARGMKGQTLTSLRRNEPEREALLGSLGAMHVLGHDVGWGTVCPGPKRMASLPVQPWRHERYWHESPELQTARLGRNPHPLLKRRMASAEPAWQTPLDLRVFGYLADHRVDHHAVFPAAGYIEMAVAGAQRATGRARVVLEEVRFQRALLLQEEDHESWIECRFDLTEGTFGLRSGIPGGEHPWNLHCQGQLDTEAAPASLPPVDPEAIAGSLPEVLGQAEIYQAFAKVGLHYGPSFQGIQSVRRRDGEALVQVALAEGLRSAGHVMHPALLDACFQTSFATLPRVSTDRTSLYLPMYVRRVCFFDVPGDEVLVHARLRHFGARLLEVDIDMLDPDGRILARFEGFSCQALDRSKSASVEGPRDWIYDVRWENHPHPAATSSPRIPPPLPAVRELAEAAATARAALVDELDLAAWFMAAHGDIDASARAFMVQFLRQLGYPLAAGDRIPAGEPAAKLNAAPHHQRLLQGFFWHLEQVGFLRRGSGGNGAGEFLEVVRTPPQQDPRVLWREGWQQHPALYPDLLLQGRCALHLGEVLRGEMNPREVLFPEGPTTTLATFYANSPTFRVVNRMMRAAVERIRDSRPEGSILRVLEVGAGTGGLTANLLPALDPLGTAYTFTDVSPVFLSRAEQRFGDYPFLDFRTLDLDTDPLDQGFAGGSADVIVASDVFHATLDLRATLRRVRQLLAPGGVLLFVEVETRSASADLVFGLTEGWWRFEDLDLRPDYPVLPRSRWIELLEECGFETPEALSLLPDEARSAQIVLMARASETAAIDATGRAPAASAAATPEPAPLSLDGGRWLLFTDQPASSNGAGSPGRGVGEQLDQLLRNAGAATLVVESGTEYRAPEAGRATVPPGDPEAMNRLVADLDPAEPIRGVLHLWSLDAEGEMSLEILRRAEVLGSHTLLHLVQALQNADRIPPGMPLMVVTRGVQSPPGSRLPVAAGQASVVGLGRVVINEHPEVRVRMVDLGDDPAAVEAANLLAELRTDDPEEELALRGESRFAPRCTRVRHIRRPVRRGAAPGTDARLQASTAGAMDQLAWKEADRVAPGPGEVEIEVHAAGLNFRDVLKALALYPAEADDYLMLGDECAGRITAVGPDVGHLSVGDAVVTMARGCFASRVVAPAAMVLPLPEGLSFEEAATIPVAFLTAHYALHEVGRLRKGESVLIQAGAGGVGMAAIQIAQRAGATVFATAGSPEKRELLALAGVDHVLDSRSLEFSAEVLRRTGGRGVDLVLNSLAGRAIQKGLACLAPFGRFLELGKRDIQENSRVGMWAFRKNLSFHAIDLGSMGLERPELLGAMFADLATRFRNGEYHALPHTVFEASRAADAFRYVAQARHIGKVVLSLRDPDMEIVRRDPEPLRFRADRTYLVTGGLSGFGVSTARWIARQGGGNLALISRSGAATEEARQAVREIEALGARVLALPADVTDPQAMRAALDQVRATLPPLAGVFHSAVVFDDGVILQMDAERFSRVMDPKVRGSLILHQLTLEDPLDYFVLYSSVSSWVGTPGQVNYVAANATMDAFGSFRIQAGLPVLTVDWGRLDEVGYVARNAEVGDILTRRGFLGFSPEQAMEGLDFMLQCERGQLGFIRLNWDVSGQALGKMRIARRVATLFGELAAEKAADDEGSRVREALRHAPPAEREGILLEYVRGQVAKVLGASAAKLDIERPLNELGFDSLMAVELKNHIDSDLAISLPTRAMMETPSILTLTAAVAGVMSGGSGGGASPGPAPRPTRQSSGKAKASTEAPAPSATTAAE